MSPGFVRPIKNPVRTGSIAEAELQREVFFVFFETGQTAVFPDDGAMLAARKSSGIEKDTLLIKLLTTSGIAVSPTGLSAIPHASHEIAIQRLFPRRRLLIKWNACSD